MMPGSAVELASFARAVLDGTVMPDTEPIWQDGTQATDVEHGEIAAMIVYEARLRVRARRLAESRPARLKAFRLLRRFLTTDQQRQLARRREFLVTAPSGRIYRFRPGTHTVQEVTQNGGRYFVKRSFCLHGDEEHALPPADTALAQLLLLSADEEEFLRTANAYDRRDQLWNGEWLRRLRQRARDEASGRS